MNLHNEMRIDNEKMPNHTELHGIAWNCVQPMAWKGAQRIRVHHFEKCMRTFRRYLSQLYHSVVLYIWFHAYKAAVFHFDQVLSSKRSTASRVPDLSSPISLLGVLMV